MNDLVERLRKAKFRQSHEVEEDAWEAANEIELLRIAVDAAEKMADFIVDYDGCDGGAWREFWDALDKLRRVDDE